VIKYNLKAKINNFFNVQNKHITECSMLSLVVVRNKIWENKNQMSAELA